MIVSWMIYSVAVALLLGGAAVGGERCLRLYGQPGRWVWVIALVAAVFLPLLGLAMPDVLPAWRAVSLTDLGGTDAAAGLWHLPRRAVVSSASNAEMLNQTILTLWIAASLVLALLFTGSAWRLRREVRTCAQSDICGIPVLVSRNLGPAVVGLKSEKIVLPSWVLAKDERARLLLAQHELEHVKVGDQRLLLAALFVVVLLPWNAALWWCFSRLRVAVEADCDLRLLRSGVDLRTYSDLLLDIGNRNNGAPISALAFSRNKSSLFRRIHLMTFKPRKRFAHTTLAAAAALTLAVAACETPTPPSSASNSASEPALGVANAAASDTSAVVARGVIRINSENGDAEPAPLFIIDGVIVDPESGFDISSLDAETIERIEVVKGASAEALYGERAAGGIINIFLKTATSSSGEDPSGN